MNMYNMSLSGNKKNRNVNNLVMYMFLIIKKYFICVLFNVFYLKI